MSHILFSVFTFVIAISVLVGIHEFGHFIIARLFKIKVIRFSIGFGKILWRTRDKKDTEYAFSLVPIGGYVKLLDSREGEVRADEKSAAFDMRPIYQRFLILIAGPAFNFILAIIAFWIIFAAGIVVLKPVMGAVKPNSLAAQASLKAGDEIIAIDNYQVLGWTSVAIALMRHYGDTKTIIISVRNTSTHQPSDHKLNVTPQNWHLNQLQPDVLSSLGIETSKPVFDKASKQYQWPTEQLHELKYPIGKALAKGTENVWLFTTFNGIVAYKMLTGVVSLRGLGGPVSIYQAATVAAGQGLLIFINFLAVISISIGLLNLLPIPGLDGGQIVYLLYERIRGKPLSASAQVLAFRLGVIILLILMTQALINDLMRL